MAQEHITLDNPQVIKITFPFSFYTINSYNNTFQVLEAANTLAITMTPGNYDSITFCTMLKSVLETASAATGATLVYTCTINDDTGILTISTAATNIGLQLALYPQSARVLGFTPANTVPAAISISSDYPVQLSMTKIFLCCNKISTQLNSYLNEFHTERILTIPLDQAPYSVITYVPQTPLFLPIQLRTTTIEFYFTDEWSNVINWNGGTWLLEVASATGFKE